nr:hypothetical protein [Pyrinomonadaceae bacterium]
MEKNSDFTENIKQSALVVGLCVGAFLLGAVVIGAGSQTLIFGVLMIFVIGTAVCFALDFPVITAVRFAFIASFFFKADVNLMKIDEIEDPSGFNLSLTVLTALILLVSDQFTDESREKVFPTSFSVILGSLFVCAVVSVIYGSSNLLGWFSVWSFLTSILIAFVIASHFSRRERLIQLVSGVAGGLVFSGVFFSTPNFFYFPTNLAAFGTGTEEELLGTQSQLLSRVPAFLRTPTEMAWIISALIPLVLAPIICRVKNFHSFQKILFWSAVMAGIV